MSYKIQRYGWRKDKLDPRDRMVMQSHMKVAMPPAKWDLRKGMPAVYNQAELGSCTAQAIAAACQYKDKTNPFAPSRLFIYYNERRLEGTIREDAGAELRDGMKAIKTWGYPDEKLWPYVIKKFATLPSKKVYKAALGEKVSDYLRVSQNATAIKVAVASDYPVIFGFLVYPEFESEAVATTGIVPMPNVATEDPLGGHAVLIVGYDDSKQLFVVRNSWGADWGLDGYFMMPYDYVVNPNLSSDFWIVRAVP